MLKLVALFPHPPIVVPEVGGKEAQKVSATAHAMEKLAQEIKDLAPSVIVTISPHGHIFGEALSVTAAEDLEGDLGRFGAPQVKVEYPLDKEAARKISELASRKGTPCITLDKETLKNYRLSPRLDHGVLVPLSFVSKAGWQGKLVPVNIGMLSYQELYRFGKTLREAMDCLKKDWVLLISGDMSHRLLPDAPAGYSPQGAVFDEIIRQCVREGDAKRLFNLEPGLVEEAGECGLRPLMIGMGAMDGHSIQSKEYSYEGPFGVGYLVAAMSPGEAMDCRELTQESPHVRLAHASIQHYLHNGRYLKDSPSEAEQELFAQKVGAFVSLKKYGQLRGCIGTIEPVQANLYREIIHNAVSAAFSDPRFEPLKPEELDELTISVDVLESPEKVASVKDLDPKVYGVIVSRGGRRGLLLPDLPGIEDADEQVRIAKQKAGISPAEEVELARFRVTRYY